KMDRYFPRFALGFRFLPSPGKPHSNSTMRNLWSLAFQQSNYVALKQLLMQVSEKSITQMGYRPQGSLPFLLFISCQLILLNFSKGMARF
ncbi:hypothetical protein ACCS64_38205, partial [Rhizobium ruizarguesonis]